MRLTTRGRYAVTALLDLALHGGGPVPPAALSVAAILDAVDDATYATSCGGAGDCQDGALCLTHGLWADLSVRIRGFLDGVSLADLLGRAEVRAVCRRQDAAVTSLKTLGSGRSSEP